MTVRTRFAPSPTGHVHIGNIRVAIFNWLFARHHQGAFLLRVEDTDRERSTPEAVDAVLGAMGWLGLDTDEEPLYQSTRRDAHLEAGIFEFLPRHAVNVLNDRRAWVTLHVPKADRLGHEDYFREIR